MFGTGPCNSSWGTMGEPPMRGVLKTMAALCKTAPNDRHVRTKGAQVSKTVYSLMIVVLLACFWISRLGRSTPPPNPFDQLPTPSVWTQHNDNHRSGWYRF